jgi:hypothetical protein
MWGVHLLGIVRALALFLLLGSGTQIDEFGIRTFSMILPRPVDPNVSIAKYSRSSILVWSSFFTSITDLPP